jgi:2-polyprenyl-3-methyl-5-hydroxy-6-metoxy-1,4-benzoquinol methylase
MALDIAPAAAEKRDALVGRLFQSAIEGAELFSVSIGNRLGFYRTLHTAGPLTSAELASRAGTAERYTREWLEQQTVAGFLETDDTSAPDAARRYRLPDAYAEIFTEPDSPYHLAPMADLSVVLGARVADVANAFRSGDGVAYDRYGLDARVAQENLNRPLATTLLPHVWLPNMPDIHARLASNPPARVADIGCGAGWSGIAIARAYPGVIVDGFDNDEPSIAAARANAAAAGVSDRVTFHLRDISDSDTSGSYDLVAAFMMVHDVGRPVDVLRTMRRLAGDRGAVLLMEMRVSDAFVAPGSPVDRFAYVSSVLYCLPMGLADMPSTGTGTAMRPETLRQYARAAGFENVTIAPVEHDFFRFYRLS